MLFIDTYVAHLKERFRCHFENGIETDLPSLQISTRTLSGMKINIVLLWALAAVSIETSSGAILKQHLRWDNNIRQPWKHFEESGTHIFITGSIYWRYQNGINLSFQLRNLS